MTTNMQNYSKDTNKEYKIYSETDLTNPYQFKNDIDMKTQLNDYMHLTETEYNEVLMFVRMHNMKKESYGSGYSFTYNRFSPNEDEKIKIKLFFEDEKKLHKQVCNLSTVESYVKGIAEYSIYLQRKTQCRELDNIRLLQRWNKKHLGKQFPKKEKKITRIQECYTHIAKNWTLDRYKSVKQEYKNIQKYIIDSETTTSYKCRCGIIWSNSDYICNTYGCCSMCDIDIQPNLANPINKQYVLEYNPPEYHRYVLSDTDTSEL